jgi:hypothetical protein
MARERALTGRSSVLWHTLARSEGFEPPTPRFEVWCSIQLSYERLGLCSEEPIKFQI